MTAIPAVSRGISGKRFFEEKLQILREEEEMKVITLSAEQAVEVATLRGRIRELKKVIDEAEKEKRELDREMYLLLHRLADVDLKQERRYSWLSPELSDDGKYIAVVQKCRN
ncbi:MAG: hypothetical protein ACE5G1_13420 [bacterium]